jgi:uncharacterized membrane protein YbhN (UPF0104 family)
MTPNARRMGEMVKYSLLLVVAAATYFFLRWKFKEHNITWAGIQEAISNVSRPSILLAIGITVVNFILLTGYDLIAVRYLKKDLPVRKVMMGAVIGYAFSNVMGWLLGGNAIRYRLYSKWGFRLFEIVAFISILSITFWLGLFLLAGIAFVAFPNKLPAELAEHMPFSSAVLGWTFLGAVAIYLIASATIRKPLRWKDSEFTLPPFRLSVMQLIVSAGDFALASAVLYVLLPPGLRQTETVGFSTIMVVYLAAMIIAVNTHVPGGFGVLDGVILALMPSESIMQVTAALILFRIVYYILPFLVALGLYVYVEVTGKEPTRGTL